MSAASLGGYTVNSFQPNECTSSKKVRLHSSPSPFPTSSIAYPSERGQRAAVDELLELRRLESDWDGEGAAAPLTYRSTT